MAYGPKGDSHPIDYNGDGRSDLLAPLWGAVLYLADGTGRMVLVSNNIPIVLATRTTGLDPRYTANIVVADLDGDTRQDILRWSDDVTKNTAFLSNGDGTFREATGFNLKTAEHTLQNGAGTNGIVLGDFTGRGRTEILRLAVTPGASGAQSNQLYIPGGNALPADQLVAVVSGTGLRTDLTWVPLGNPSSGSLGPRYRSDRATAQAAAYPQVDTLVPGHVVASTTTDSGIAGQRVTTEYSYIGQKSSHDGRHEVTFREVRSQQPGLDGTPLSTATQLLQQHPYTGAVARTQTWRGGLNETNPQALSRSEHLHCDKTSTQAPAQAGVDAPCLTTAKIQRPYLYRTTTQSQDLNGAPLPVTTTTTTYNDTGDPTQVNVRTAADGSQVVEETTTHDYHADLTHGDYWIIGRARQTQVRRTVPDNLASLTASAGSAPQASATAGSGPVQAGTLSAVSFGNVAVGAASTLTATLTSRGLAALTLNPAPGLGAVSGSDFSFVSSNCPAALAAGASCTVTVRFAPTAVAARTGTLALGTGAGTLSAALAGTGTGAVATLTSAPTLSASAAWYGSASRSVTASYRNDGNASMSLASPALAAPLSVTGNSCTGVAPGAGCNIAIAVATTVPGLNQSQAFAPAGATNTPVASTVTWSNQTAVPRWGSTSLAFGNITTGTSSTQNLTLINDGNTAYNWAASGTVAGAPAGFAFNSSACASVAPGGSCVVGVTFAPTAAGSHGAGGLTMAAASYSSNTFAVSGTGITPPSITASAATVSATSVAPAAASASVSFSNTGQTPTTLTLAVSGGASVSASTLNCPANGSCGTVTVTSPAAAGTYNGSLTVVSSAGGTVPAVSVNLAVAVPPVIGISPASLSFTLAKGQWNGSTVTITNSGGVAATGLVLATSGGSATVGQFYATRLTCPAAGGSLAAGASCTVTVDYTSGCTAGTTSGSFTVSGANFATQTINLSGKTLSGNCP